MPAKSTEPIAGRSTTCTMTTLPSLAILTSLKKPVAYSARIASEALSSSNVSPCLIGRYENTVPASTRCNPSIRISRTTNESAACAARVVILRPTRANTFAQRDDKIFAFMQDMRKEIQLEHQPHCVHG